MKTTPKELDLSQFEGHTEGPWKITTCCDYVIQPAYDNPKYGEDGAIAIVGSIEWANYETMQAEWELNARLFAAAPTLLAEVKRLRAENERLTKQYRDYFHMDKTGSGSAQTAILRKALNPEEPE